MTGSIILPAIAAVTAFLIIMLAMGMATRKETTRQRLERMASNSAPQEELKGQDEIEDPLTQDQELSGLGMALEQLLRVLGMNPDGFRKSSALRFYRAGMHSMDAPIYYLFFKRIGFLVFIGLGFMIVSKGGTGTTKLLHYMMALLMVALALMGPDMIITNQRTKREKVLQRSFPDALDLLLVCVESGLALDGALARVCKELGRAHPEITHELNRTRLELTLLNDRTTALTNLAQRTDMLCFRSLVTTLLQSEKFGTSLTDTLRVLSEDFRNTRLMLAEEKAGRLPVIMTIPLITLLIPALFLIILGPAILNVMHILAGNK